MKLLHSIYCNACSQKTLEKWKGWPLRDTVPILSRIINGTCETCGKNEYLESSKISWLNYHSEFSTGLPDYWLLIITNTENKWGQPYYSESNCPQCNKRTIISQMNYPNGTREMCHNCENCGTIKI